MRRLVPALFARMYALQSAASIVSPEDCLAVLLEAKTDCVPLENLDREKGSWYVKERVNGILEMK